jgi:hypothetical protein
MQVLVKRERTIRAKRDGQLLTFEEGVQRMNVLCRNAPVARRTVEMVDRVRAALPALAFERVIEMAMVAVDREREIEAGIELYMRAGMGEAQAFARAVFDADCALRFRERKRRVPQYGRVR